MKTGGTIPHSTRLPHLLPWLFIGLGIALRLVVYAQNRSLIIDEANLALNIVEQSNWSFFQSLDYQQYCPPLFGLLSKAIVGVGGVNEWSLKLLPLLSGLGTLFLLFYLAKRWIKSPLILGYVLGLAAFSELLVRYSTEVKQYSTDGLLALGLLLWAQQCYTRTWRGADYVRWALVGGLVIWASMPSVFLLATIGLVRLWQELKQTRQVPWALLGVGGFWLLNFGFYFSTVLYQDSVSNHLQAYHAPFFMELWPTSMEAWAHNYGLVISLLTSVTDHTVLGLAFGAAMLVWGGRTTVRQSKPEALLLFLPILLSLVASGLHLYSLIPRLTVFFVPMLLLLVGIGVEDLWQRAPRCGRLILGMFMVLTLVNKNGYRYFRERLEVEDSKAVLAYLKQHYEGQPIFVQLDGRAAFRFYNEYHDQATHFKSVYFADWNELPTIEHLQHPSQQFWLFFSHTFPETQAYYITEAQHMATEVQAFSALNASVYLWTYAPPVSGRSTQQ